MRGAACAGDDDLESGGLRAFGEGEQPLRSAVGGHDVLFASHAECVQRFGGVTHGFPVRLASHDDGYWRAHAVNSFRKSAGNLRCNYKIASLFGKASAVDSFTECQVEHARKNRQWTILFCG